jgi:hypothetical protein
MLQRKEEAILAVERAIALEPNNLQHKEHLQNLKK